MPPLLSGATRAPFAAGALALLLSFAPLAEAGELADGTGEIALAPAQVRAVGALHERTLRADAQKNAAEAFFRGEFSTAAAWPALESAPIGDTAWRRGERERLRRAAVGRAAERVAAPPAGLPPGAVRALRRAQAEATEAESRADALEIRLLDSLDAGFARAPALGEPSWGQRLHRLDAEAGLQEDVDASQLAQAATAAEQAAAFRQWRRAAIGAMTRPDDPSLQALADAALADAPLLPSPLAGGARTRTFGLMDRLVRVAPLLPAPAAAAVWIEAADAALYPVATVRPGGAPTVAPRSVAQREGHLRVAHAEAEALRGAVFPAIAVAGGAPGSAQPARPADARAHLWIRALTDELQTAQALLTAGGGAAGPQPSAAEAERLAELARAQVDGAAASDLALRTRNAELRERTAAAVRAEEGRRTDTLREFATARTTLDGAQAELHAALELPSLDPDRPPAIDGAYMRLRAITAELTARAGARAARSQELDLSPVPPWRPPAGADPVALAELRAAEADLRASQAGTRRTAIVEQDLAVGFLVEAKGARRLAREAASAEAQLAGQRAFIPELGHEQGETWWVLQARARAALRELRGLPAQLTDLAALLGLLTGSVEGVMGAVLWWGLRRGLPQWVLASMGRLQATHGRGLDRWSKFVRWIRSHLRPGDLRTLAPQLTGLSVAAVDGAAALAVAWAAPSGSPFVETLGVAVAGHACWRAARPLVHTALSCPGELRPSLLIVEPPIRARVLRGLRYLLIWRVADRLLYTILVHLLAADRSAQLVEALSNGLGVALTIALLWTWSPELQQAAATAEPSRAMRWAASPSLGLGRLPRAAVGLILLTGRLVWGTATDALAAHTRLRWIGAAMARRQYARRSADAAPTAGPLAAALLALRLPPPPNLRPAITSLGLIAAAGAPVQPGVYAIVGDNGSGLEALPEALAELGVGLTVLRPTGRLRAADPAIAWLAEALGCAGGSLEALTTHLLRRGGTLLLFDLHLLFLRTVGGFDALQAILELMQATSDRCTWVCAARSPTWSLLRGAPQAVDLSIFRGVVELEPLSAEALGAWLLPSLSRAGLQGRFGALDADGERTHEPRAELRAQAGYLRLLEDLSQGYPLVAEGLWRRSHREGAAPGEVEHSAPAVPKVLALLNLGDEELFMLTALAVHGSLTVAELALVLNRPEGAVQAACRRLASEQLLRAEGPAPSATTIDPLALPQTLRLLRNRAFLPNT